jgi:hypothetical protein
MAVFLKPIEGVGDGDVVMNLEAIPPEATRNLHPIRLHLAQSNQRPRLSLS